MTDEQTYEETLTFLFSQLPQYQKIGGKAYKASLDNILAISYLIGNPQNKIKTIHVAGSNGKGSVSNMLASVLQECGYKVGLYTSPHLKDFRERIKINGKEVSEKKVVKFVGKHKEILKEIKPSFFEWTVGLAFSYFASKKVDVAVIETGLGGRLDSTNIITPEISVITNIALEHTSILGNSLNKIAIEKAGIIKKNIPVVIGETQDEIKNVFIEKATKFNSKIYFADQLVIEPFSTDLKGDYQTKNVKTVMQALNVLAKQGWSLSTNKIEKGLLNVAQNNSLLGRWQVVSEKPQIIYDVAHNKEAILEILKTLKKEDYKKLHIVIGMAKDKDREEVYKILPPDATYYFCSGDNNRLINATDLRYEAVMHSLHGKDYDTAISALSEAKLKAKKKHLILVTGSFFVVSQVL